MAKAQTTDHDLLIRLDEKVDGLSKDIKDLKDNLASRVDHLEDEKMSKEDFDLLKVQCDKTQQDHEDRLRSLEYWKWLLAGAMIVISFIAPYIVNYFVQ